MASLLPSTQYEAIRKAIAVDLTAADLPDATIALDLYAGRARREVLARDPDAESREGAELARVRLAAALLCAAYLCPAVPQITAEDDGTLSATRRAFDPATRAEELRAQAEAELSAVLTPENTIAYRPPTFATARGRRGR